MRSMTPTTRALPMKKARRPSETSVHSVVVREHVEALEFDGREPAPRAALADDAWCGRPLRRPHP